MALARIHAFISPTRLMCAYSMPGPKLQMLIQSMGERRAYRHIERILQLADHTGACIRGESAATPARRAETELLARLRELNVWGLEIEDSAGRPRAGDIIVTGGVVSVWDSKLYSRRVPRAQYRKLARDVRACGGAFGVLVGGEPHFELVDGVPIHVCTPGGPEEFTCLYLTMLGTPEDTRHVTRTADAAHIQNLLARSVDTLQRTIDALNSQRDCTD